MCLAAPGRIIEIDDADPIIRMAKVSFGGAVRDVSLAYVAEAQVDDYVMVHAGLALSVVDEEEAAETLSYLERIAELQAEEEAAGPQP